MKDRTSLVRAVEYNDNYYLHIIDLDDDHIRVYDEDQNLVLIYTSSGIAKLPSGEILGAFHMEGGYDTGYWQFEFMAKFGGEIIVGQRCIKAEGLLDTEVLVTQAYLRFIEQ